MTEKNGYKRLGVRVRRVPGMPTIYGKIMLRGGAWDEATPGQSLVTGRLLTEGTHRRDWNRIVEESEALGMSIQSSSTYETSWLSIDALSEDWETALDWLAELSFESTFPEDRFEWVRRQAAAELDGLLDQPDIRTLHAFLHQLYGPHPYGRSLFGSRKDLESLTVEDCIAFHQRSLEHGALIVLAGDLDPKEVTPRIEQLFAKLEGPATLLRDPPEPQASETKRQVVQAGEADQAHLYAGHLTMPRNHPQAAALELIGVVLGAGAGLSGRLPERIREKEGLAYTAQVAIRSGSGYEAGRLVIYVGTSPTTVEKAERAVREELQRLLDQGISRDELEEARSYLIGREPLSRQTASQWVDVLAEAEFYGMPSDRLEWVTEQLRALTQEEVLTTARQFIRPDELQITVGLPR